MKFKITLLLMVVITTAAIAQQNGPTELVAERSMFSKTFINEQGAKETIISGEPKHYNEFGEWKSISTNLNLQGSHYVNTTNVIASAFPRIYGTGDINLTFANEQIQINAEKKLVSYSTSMGLVELAHKESYSTTVSGSTVVYGNASYADKFEVKKGQVKNEFIIQKAVQNSGSGVFFGFQEVIELPTGWSIQSIQNQSFTSEGLRILNQDNEHILSIPAPVYYDANTFNSDGADFLTGHFLISNVGNTWTLNTLIPTNWLNDQNRSFPITIDPTVTLAGIDGGWQSQNNFVNNPNFAFIGVCCGNLEHRAWIKYNTASIPDASCVTNVELEVFVNGVGAATAELVHAYDVTGAFGPYAAIIPAVYTDFGDGYYTSFTLTTAGTYGYYDLGTSADALLQSQLPGDLYQVALIFDNEPSTNWKRLTATQCNLRVTYDNPPCAVLPVELLNFEASCDNGKTALTWSTSSEVENDRFEIQKLQNGIFETIGEVKGSGNSSVLNSYSFEDVNRTSEVEYYQLKQIDYNGDSKTFNTLASNCQMSYELLKAHLSSNDLMVQLYAGNAGAVEVSLTDITGKTVFNTQEIINQGNNQLGFNNLNLKPGIYFLSLRNGEFNASEKLVVIN